MPNREVEVVKEFFREVIGHVKTGSMTPTVAVLEIDKAVIEARDMGVKDESDIMNLTQAAMQAKQTINSGNFEDKASAIYYEEHVEEKSHKNTRHKKKCHKKK